MSPFAYHGPESLGTTIAASLPSVSGLGILLNAERDTAPEVVVARALHFASTIPDDKEGLIVTLLHQSPAGLDHFAGRSATASLWAFTREAALEWAPRRIRVNAIGLGAVPVSAEIDQPAFALPAVRATEADIARVVVAMVAMASMTGQLVRLGG